MNVRGPSSLARVLVLFSSQMSIPTKINSILHRLKTGWTTRFGGPAKRISTAAALLALGDANKRAPVFRAWFLLELMV
jgi:hypothetical protein